MIFPAYASFKALETPEKDDDKQLLTYWVVYGLFHFVEFFTQWALSYIPFYWEIKICFVIWLQLPQTKGALMLYTKYLEPFLMKNQEQIDRDINAMGSKGYNALKQGLTAALKQGAKYVSENEDAKKSIAEVAQNILLEEAQKK